MLKLSDICSFVSDKINIEELSTKCYVSTDNMLPDCGGIVEADTIPNVTKTSAFSKGDVLFSNIRPYFRKVWLSDRFGGCSNDVLVLRPLSDISPLFLYYVVSDAGFIKYVMKGAKGTKMPRGDKSHIMNYEINPIALENSEKIVSILGPIDYKIQINKHINDNLAA